MSLDYFLCDSWSCERSDLKLLFSQNFVLIYSKFHPLKNDVWNDNH